MGSFHLQPSDISKSALKSNKLPSQQQADTINDWHVNKLRHLAKKKMFPLGVGWHQNRAQIGANNQLHGQEAKNQTPWCSLTAECVKGYYLLTSFSHHHYYRSSTSVLFWFLLKMLIFSTILSTSSGHDFTHFPFDFESQHFNFTHLT